MKSRPCIARLPEFVAVDVCDVHVVYLCSWQARDGTAMRLLLYPGSNPCLTETLNDHNLKTKMSRESSGSWSCPPFIASGVVSDFRGSSYDAVWP